MAYEIEAGFENICRKILESSRNALYINMRYLDVALSSLAWEITTDIPRIGTDGLKIAYEPHYLADLYRENPMLVNRVYLHMVFHCIFRHLFRPCPEDRELWNLSCDIAVEALIDGMHHRSIRMGVHPFRRAVYDELRKTLKVLTAEGIYRELKKADYRPEQRARMVQEFCIDDHTYWPAPPEEEGPKPPSPLMAKLKKHWKDVSDRMLKLRRQSVDIIFTTYSGLRVSSDALRYEQNVPGVYVLDKTTIRFKPVEIIKDNGNFLLCEPRTGTDDSHTLSRLDLVIIESGGIELKDGALLDEDTVKGVESSNAGT